MKIMELRQFVIVFGMATACLAGSAHGEDPVQQFSSDRVQLIGVASLPGNMADLSELTGVVAEGIPQNRFGGISAIDRLGNSSEYILTLVAVLQSPLIQETEMSPSGYKTDENCRIVRMDTSGGHREQFAYHLDNHMNGLSEILAIDHDRFLVIERDSTSGSESVFKKIMLVDLSKATDVSQMERLPVRALPVAIAAANKQVLIDMLDPRFGLAGTDFPEKLEGLAWGARDQR